MVIRGLSGQCKLCIEENNRKFENKLLDFAVTKTYNTVKHKHVEMLVLPRELGGILRGRMLEVVLTVFHQGHAGGHLDPDSRVVVARQVPLGILKVADSVGVIFSA